MYNHTFIVRFFFFYKCFFRYKTQCFKRITPHLERMQRVGIGAQILALVYCGGVYRNMKIAQKLD